MVKERLRSVREEESSDLKPPPAKRLRMKVSYWAAKHSAVAAAAGHSWCEPNAARDPATQ